MNLLSKEWRQHIILLMLFASIACLLMFPIASNLMIPTDIDYLWHSAVIMKAKTALATGQFPLRTIPSDHGQLAYPLFQFYSPTSYTIAGWLYQWLGLSNPFITYKIILWLSLIFGGTYMYRLAYWFVKSTPAAVLASVAYLTMPHHIIIIDHMGAFNETLALGVVPAVLYYTIQLYTEPSRFITWLQTAAGWYFLITIHIVTFVATSFFVGLFLLLVTLQNTHHWKNLFYVGIAYFFGCVLAAWYLAPLLLFSKYLIANRLFNNADIFNSFSPTLSNLLSPLAHISNGWKVNGITNSMSRIHPNIGLPILLAVGVVLFAYWNKLSSKNNWLASLCILFFIAFILIWSPINFWQWLPQQCRVIQYSWRLMGQIMWIGPLLLAWSVCWLFNNKLHSWHTIIGTLLIILSSCSWLLIPEEKMDKTQDIASILASEDNLIAKGYLIDATTHRKFINLIDSIMINSSISNVSMNLLSLKPIAIPALFISKETKPYLSLQGNIPTATYLPNQFLNAMVNGAVKASYSITPGKFNWNIPLAYSAESKKMGLPLIIQFKLNHHVDHKSVIDLKQIALEGLLNPRKILNVRDIEQHCVADNADTLCNLAVPASTQLLELPIYYYPQLLNITVNGKSAPYVSVFNKDFLITAIMPQVGFNKIKIEFRGILSANFLSAASWQLWLILIAYIGLRKVFYAKPA